MAAVAAFVEGETAVNGVNTRLHRFKVRIRREEVVVVDTHSVWMVPSVEEQERHRHRHR